jgi:hypothetical protein
MLPLQKFICSLHCTENLKHIFPEMKLSGLVPSFYIHVSVSSLYIPTISLRQTGHGIIEITHIYMNVEIER